MTNRFNQSNIFESTHKRAELGCEMLYELKWSVDFMATLLGLCISFGNTAFRFLVIYLIKFLDYDNLSHLQVLIKQVIFAISFFNSGLLVLLMNADLDLFYYTKIDGKYRDFR